MGEVVGALTQTQISPFKQDSLFAEDVFIPELGTKACSNASCREKVPDVGDRVLRVMAEAELTAAHSRRFRKQVRAALNGHTSVEIDLSHTTTLDCAGLGALIAIRNLARDRKGVVRLVNPGAGVQQLLELMRAGELFELVKTAV